MNATIDLPWPQINDFLLSCGAFREPRELCIEIIRRLYLLVPFDQARVYFINDNGLVTHAELLGVDKKWNRLYLDYYSKIEDGRYGILSKTNKGRSDIPISKSKRDWTDIPQDEFILDYIKPQGLLYSLGFVLHDADNLAKSLFSLDRTSRHVYTDKEIAIMSILHAHLDNLHKNFFIDLNGYSYTQKSANSHLPLTIREREIVGLLCQGVTSKNISNKLSVSMGTVYKHIANVYEKLEISSRSELIIRMLEREKRT